MSKTIQGSDEWAIARCGRVTASRINDVMATLKSGGEASTRKNYRAQIIAERLTCAPCGVDLSWNKSVLWGTDNEPIARAMYEIKTGSDVEQVGFVDHPSIAMTGASPDGRVGNNGMLEIKCPNTATHIEYLLAGVAPTEYHNQMLWQMECDGRDWCDFVSFDPRMPEAMQLFIVRFNKDEDKLSIIRAEVCKFLGEVDNVISRLTANTKEQ